MADKTDYKGYQSVQERIKAFYEQYPGGSIVTEPVTIDGKTAFKAMGYRNYVEQVNNCPGATGWSQTTDKSNRTFTQFEFEEMETSAIGRMVKNLGLIDENQAGPSLEEMERSAKVNKKTNRADILKPCAEIKGVTDGKNDTAN